MKRGQRKEKSKSKKFQVSMELSQARSFGTEGAGRKPTHDFLSLYSHSTAQQDPRPPSQGSYLKTHDFLQPLERLETKASAKEEAIDEISSVVQRPSLPAPPPSVEHLLPGGIGTYSISHISYNNNNNNNLPKPEASLFNLPQATSTDRNDDNSNGSSYTASGFTLWTESAFQKGKTGKENNVGEKPILGDSAAELGQWTLTKRTSQSLSSNRHNGLNSLPSSQTTGQKNQGFVEMMKSAKDCVPDEKLDNEEAFILNKESSSNAQRVELRVKADGNCTDQKPNTPRSKHSATEQRRRSKINDRFQMLRELIPHSDQKRDKASFLLEVIDYIHFLQEKVHKYEGSFQGWNHEPEKLMPWQRNNHRPAESSETRAKNSGSGPSSTLPFASKIDENVESGLCTGTTFNPMDQHPGVTNKAMPIPISSQPNFFTPSQGGGAGGGVSQLTHRLSSDAGIYQPSVLCQTSTCSTEVTATTDKQKEKELTIEGGAIGISSVYSKGLLDTLTQALQCSGVDLSQASISVQIELGKQANIRPTVPMCGAKDDEVPRSNQGIVRSRVAISEKSDQAVKKPKTCRS